MSLGKLRLGFCVLFVGGVAAAAISTAVLADKAAAGHGSAGQEQVGRKTTDPPVAAKGKLGQELFLAIDHRDTAGVQSLLKQGADPNARNGLEFTPLYIAAASHQPEVVAALLSAGAKVDAPSAYGTALLFAAMGGNVDGANVLIARGANVNATKSDGTTVLMMASRAGTPELVGELLRRKVDVNARDSDGTTALIYAARDGRVEVGRLLLAAGAAVDGSDSHRQTPLMAAAVAGHADFVKLLLEKGANCNAHDAKGETALLLAATYGDYPDVIKTLLDSGATGKAGAASTALARNHSQCAALLGAASTGSPGAAMQRTPKEAVQASLKLLESSMLRFNKRTGCLSCHQEGLGRMATGAAADHGFRLDPAVDQAQVGRINGAMNALQPLHLAALKDPEAMKQVPLIEINEVATGDTWLLAGMAAHKQPATEANGAMTMVVARQQAADGPWRFSLPREPMQSSFFTFTALAIRSLRTYGPQANATEIADRIARAKSWLLKAPTQTSEDRASRLLGLKWAGANPQEMQTAVDELRADQRPDGGWSQLATLQSDAYATGQALYALHTAGGLSVADPVYQQGVQLLLRTQDRDGSWFVSKRAMPANNYFDAGFPHGESQYASFNGTCWAVMALLETVDDHHVADRHP